MNLLYNAFTGTSSLADAAWAIARLAANKFNIVGSVADLANSILAVYCKIKVQTSAKNLYRVLHFYFAINRRDRNYEINSLKFLLLFILILYF